MASVNGHPEYVNHSPGAPTLPRGREGVVIVVEALRWAMPDLNYELEETRQRINVTQITFERFRKGQIVAHHRLTDELAMLRSLVCCRPPEPTPRQARARLPNWV